jgi:pyruvate/2-oxoglutarate dehydrogenase complex dihydrolipoamide dehydrogenase (E3) component
MSQQYDAIIIGAGQAGPALAARLAAAGQAVAIIERHQLGGTCVNTGCTPTKTLIASARISYQVRIASEYGVDVAGGVAVNISKVNDRKDRVVKERRDGLETWLRSFKNCSLYKGHAEFDSAHTVRVNGELLTAENIFINVGGRPRIPSFPGIDSVSHLTSSSMLNLAELPAHLIIVGGSYIGLEFAQMYRRFGSQVTVIEKQSRLVSHEDEEISAAITSILESEGIEVRTGAECIHLYPDPAGVAVGVNCATGAPRVAGTHVLLAVGRQPNTADLGLAQAGIVVDKSGFIGVDDELRTNVPGVWALGDCNGKGAFTHTAYNDYEIVEANLLGTSPRRVSDRIGCYALFVDPPLGRVGLTERDARARGHRIRVGSRPMTRVARAIEKGETAGLMKVVVDADSNLILGAAILGVGGDEAIHGILDIMTAKVPFSVLQQAVHIHPTVSELIPTILGELSGARESGS